MRAAGSTPGVAKKIRKTSTLMPNITNSIDEQPADDERDHSSAASAELGARVERVAHAVAEDVERRAR